MTLSEIIFFSFAIIATSFSIAVAASYAAYKIKSRKRLNPNLHRSSSETAFGEQIQYGQPYHWNQVNFHNNFENQQIASPNFSRLGQNYYKTYPDNNYKIVRTKYYS